ncbi:MAG: glycosyltransferase family 1 protein [Bryobacteraceae bacterium]
MSGPLIRVGVVCDLVEENWPSMDLVAEMLVENLKRECGTRFEPEALRPEARQRPGRMRKASRFAGRFWRYPRYLAAHKGGFDLFHIVDHSYAHLVHELPADRTVVTCHDLDTFRCLFAPEAEPRSALFRRMTQRILDGFRKAAHVTCDSESTRAEVLAHNLIPPSRLTVIPNGVHPSCSVEADPDADAEIARILAPASPGRANILHVGSVIPRKRIDTLLRTFAAVRSQLDGQARLIRVGGALTREQAQLAAELGIEQDILTLPRLGARALAAVYRTATVLLQPSEREGFGLPVAEAMACGCPVVASDLPVLRETGGEAAIYCPVGEPARWADAVARLLAEPVVRRSACLRQAARFSWTAYARQMTSIYEGLMP